MEPRISIITLGVDDLSRSIQFYRDGLGLPLRDDEDTESIAFFETSGTWLALYPQRRPRRRCRRTLGRHRLLRRNPGPQRPCQKRRGRTAPSGSGGRRDPGEARRGRLLGRVLRLLHRPGRPSVGGRMEPLLPDRVKTSRPIVSPEPGSATISRPEG